MHKKLFFFIIIGISTMLLHGQSTNSPYSRFGIGDISNKGFGLNKSLGGASYAVRSNEHISISNPASYSALDTMSLIFDVGIIDNYTNFRSADNSAAFNNVNLNYLNIAFPVTKWLYSDFGLIPYSTVGYDYKSHDSLETVGDFLYNYIGSGGINQVYYGFALKPFKNFSVGANISYLFGSLVYAGIIDFTEDANAFDFYKFDSTVVKGIYLDFGLQFTHKIGDKTNICIGGTFNNKSNLNAFQSSIIKIHGNSAVFVSNDTIKTTEKVVLPMNFGGGISVSYDNKLMLTAEYQYQKWSESSIFGTNNSLSDCFAIRGGLEYAPKINSITNYLQRIRYRAGGHYSTTYLNINGVQLADMGISLGVGLPLRRTKTSFNVSCEIGHRGTTSDNLIKENYAVFSINLTLHDFWFMKRKIE